jgi:hypothetical protein
MLSPHSDSSYFTDLDKGPVFDSYSNDLSGGLVFDSYSDDLDRGPVHEEFNTDKDLGRVLDAQNQDLEPSLFEQACIAMVSRNIDTNTHAGVLTHICRVFHQGCSSIGDQGELCLDTFELLNHVHGVAPAFKLEMRSVISSLVATDGCEVIISWNPGLPYVSPFIEIARPGTDFAPAYYVVVVDGIQQKFWDPGLLEGLQFIGFAEFNQTRCCELQMDKFESKSWDPGLAEGLRFIV